MISASIRRDSPWLAALAVALACVAPGLKAATPSLEYPVGYIEDRLRGEIVIVEQAQARPKIEGDRSTKVVLAGADDQPDITVHWKPVAPPGQGFNNEPRYELAAYRFQQLFLDECQYVVPPVVLRALPLEEYRRIRPVDQPTLRGTSSALFMLTYWLADVTNRDPWDKDRFAREARYARHFGNLNALTHLINHQDANIGNLLISTHPDDPRVFAVDNDVAFRSKPADTGDTWKRLLVDRLPADTIDRLRQLTQAELERELGVVAEFTVAGGVLHPAETFSPNMDARRGVRVSADRVQFGLTAVEIRDLQSRISRLLAQVDRGRIQAVAATPENLGLACPGALASNPD